MLEVKRSAGRIELIGQVELATVPPFREALAAAVGDAEGSVVVDLRAVTFMDSSGLASLLNAQRRLTRQGRRLTLLVAQGPVERLLQTTRLDSTFAVADSTQTLDLP